ncbi:myosin-binding protein C, cardiac-type-like isoform X3 [Montipora capricornis]|uniref:myosin-binding protein C, cardiac-type-like isoform X3 n=1 Tax=Montipora capricornis TaxID=246305 RepID=UPI0035F157AF
MAVQYHFLIFELMFLLTLLKVSFADDFTVNFTAKPKDTEYFVGKEAILRWKFHSANPDTEQIVHFGKVAPPEDHASASEDVAILVKYLNPPGRVVRNNRHRMDAISFVSNRTIALENETSSFKIVNLTFNDTGKYFFRLRRQDAVDYIHFVQLKVVDIMIDYQNSTPVLESWEGHKVTLKCAVQTTLPDLMARFFWEQNGNPLLFGKKVNRETSSQMTVVTVKDVEFNPVTCSAKTKSTTQRLEIKIKRLYKPSEPVNMTVQEKESNDTSCKIYNKLSWDPPVDSGDTPMTSYQVEYKHPVLKKIMHRTTTQNTEHAICKVQISGHPRELNVNVRGVNKVGRGFRSETIKVLFYKTPAPPNNLVRGEVFYDEFKTPYLKVTWEAPNYDGGAPVRHYIVEHKTVKTKWGTANISVINKTEFSFPAHKSEIYTVRVRAVNSLGEGKPSNFITVKLTEEDVKTLRSSNASSSLSASGFFEAFLLLLTVCFSLA